MDGSPPGSSLHGVSRQDYWSGLPCSPPGDLPQPGMEPASLMSPGLAGGFFTTSTTSESPEGTGTKFKNVTLEGWRVGEMGEETKKG